MTLQKRTLGVIALTTMTLIVALYFASQVIVLGSFADQEKQEMQQNVERVQSALDDNLKLLEGTTRDWSIWDDTYNYIEGRDESYFDANLANDTPMVGNQLNLMMFIDSNANIVVVKTFDYHNGRTIPVPDGLREQIYLGSPLLDHKDANSSITGLLSLPGADMLLASEPILTSAGDSPVAGTLIFGRFLDEGAMAHLAKATLLGITLESVDNPGMTEDLKEVLPGLTEASPVALKALSSTAMVGYKLLNDVYNKPALVLKVEMPRNMYARGQQTIRYYVVTLIVAGLVFGGVIVLLLERLVLSRLAHLRSDMGRIESTTDMSGRVAIGGNDELSSLGASINGMLSALQRSREEQKESEEKYRAVVEQTTDAIFLVDAQTGRFLDANAASQTLLGYSQEELLGVRLEDVMEPDTDRRTGLLTGNRTTSTLHWSSERRYKRRSGSIVPVEVSDNPIMYGGREVLCVVARDITDRKRAEAVLRDLAMRDGLTGLYNRREMQRILREQAEQYERTNIPAALVLLDIDHFKTVNDSYGHQVGDDVLRWIAKLTQEMVRVEDKATRYGGEELAVILPGADSETAYEIAERLRNAIATQPFKFMQITRGRKQEVLIPITISAGVASLPQDAQNEIDIIQAADRALYEAKSRGRNCTVTCKTLRTQSRQRAGR